MDHSNFIDLPILVTSVLLIVGMLASKLVQGTTLQFVARLLQVDEPLEAKNTQRLLFTPTGASKHDLVEVVVPESSSVVGRRIVERIARRRAQPA
ncbi:hypothetical protein [Deinococcus pimensis]|uniref:hypothetical protein n=1 Tax=Deinococcus pimensis TaxID=309888 RepID=UPI000484F1A7|nr:hypothetical protein [Deinococcus pimensis]